MDEEETKQEPEATTEDTGKGDKYETTPLLERTREEREKLDAANEKKEKLLNREEEIIHKRMLGGGSEAGAVAEKKAETDEEYTEKYLKGEVDPFKDDGVK